MVFNRMPMKDPRTVAREIPGIFEAIFPQLTPSVIAYFNKQAISLNEIFALPDALVKSSSLKPAMLFEVAIAKGEQILSGICEANWNESLSIATQRQRRYFDAQLPAKLEQIDIKIAEWVAGNLTTMIGRIISKASRNKLTHSPAIPGYQWIMSGEGDFSLETTLIEVKCTNKYFGSADIRQVLMYWLLSYAASIEHGTNEWKNVILLNPRKNHIVELSFNEIIETTAAGKSKIEILELFSSMVGDIALKALPEFKF